MTKRINLPRRAVALMGALPGACLNASTRTEAVEIRRSRAPRAGALNGAALKAGITYGAGKARSHNWNWLWAQMGGRVWRDWRVRSAPPRRRWPRR